MDRPAAPGWWMASDGRWYPPELRPAPATPPPPSTPPPWVTARPLAPPSAAALRGPLAGSADSRLLLPYDPSAARRPLHLASYWTRMGGYVVDAVVIAVASFLLILLGLAISHARSLLVAVAPLLLFLLWYLVWRLGRRGHTWGMQLGRMVLADKTTGQYPAGIGRALVRLLFFIGIGLVPFGQVLDLLWPLWDPYKQTLHDKVAGTIVIYRS